MNARPLSRRIRPGRCGARRAPALAALAAAALLVVGCGSSPPGAAGSAHYQKALAFSTCMRAHGALGFPDPTSAGTITVTQALLNSPQIQSASSSCQNLLPGGVVQIPAALQRRLETQALQYSACMRSHGVPNFPDPTVDNGAIGFSMPSGVGPHAPPFQAAQRDCQKLKLRPGSR
jgi:hypothetical protein